jgi:hypothetical protein
MSRPKESPDHHQGIICCVAFDRSSLRRIASYASLVAPPLLASDAFLVIGNIPKPAFPSSLREVTSDE